MTTVIDICRFEKGPQDLPRSVGMLGAFLATCTLGRTLVALFTMPAGMAALTDKDLAVARARLADPAITVEQTVQRLNVAPSTL